MKQKNKKISTREQEIHAALACHASSAKRLYILMLLLTYGLFALNTLVLSPLWSSLASDVLIPELLPNLVSALMYVIHLSVIPAAAWCLIGFAYFRREASSVVRRLTIFYFGSLFFCRFCDMAAALMLNGALYLEEDIIYPAWYLILDLIYNLVLFFLMRSFVMKHRAREVAKVQAALAASPKHSVEIRAESLYPFGKFYKKGNPVQSLTLRFAGILAALTLIQEILYTVAYLYDSTNPLTGMEIFVMVGRYLDALLVGVFFYLFSLLLYRFLFRKAIAEDEDEDNEEEELSSEETTAV